MVLHSVFSTAFDKYLRLLPSWDQLELNSGIKGYNYLPSGGPAVVCIFRGGFFFPSPVPRFETGAFHAFPLRRDRDLFLAIITKLIGVVGYQLTVGGLLIDAPL